MLYFELKRYENYLKTHCNLNINKYSYQSDLIKNDVQFFTKSANMQDRVLAYRDIYEYNSIRDFVAFRFGVSSLLESYRINNAYSHRVCRLRSKVYKILENPTLFVTFTFDDYCLSSTSFDTRRRYVRRFLSTYSDTGLYVGNVDYGEQEGREHYHALINCRSLSCDNWTHGIINFERVRVSSDIKVLSQYVAKLTNHAIKETTKRRGLIYPKIKYNKEI